MSKSDPQNLTAPDDQAAAMDGSLRTLLGYHLKRASNVIQADLMKTLKPFKLRMVSFSALSVIVDHPGISQSQLSDVLDIERPNLVVVIDELERRELISRERDPSDRRVYLLKPTLAGMRLFRKAFDAVAKHEQRFLNAIGPDRRDPLVETLLAIKTAS